MTLVGCAMESVLQTASTPARRSTWRASPENSACVIATSTRRAPARSSSRAASASVRPVLATSSTSTTRRPVTGTGGSRTRTARSPRRSLWATAQSVPAAPAAAAAHAAGRRRQRHAVGVGQHVGEACHAVQVGIHCDDAIEERREEGADVPLAHGFARHERAVLPHVGQVGRDQGDLLRPEGARGLRSEQQLHELLVGVIERTQDGHAARKAWRQRDPQLVVGEPVAAHERCLRASRARQPPGEAALVIEVQQHHGPATCPGGS